MRIFALLLFVSIQSHAAVFFPAMVASEGGGSGSLDVTLPNLATTTGTNPPTSRTSCVSPCAVYFDAQGTTSSLTTRPFHELLHNWDFGDVVSGAAGTCTDGAPVAREQGQGSYCTGVVTANPNSLQPLDSKNFARGPEAAHVFECLTSSPTYSAGFCTYTVTLRASQGDADFDGVWDATEYKTTTTTITVQEADNYYANTTACVANGVTPVAGSNGCPSGANNVQDQANAATAISAAFGANGCGASTPCKRVLFRRGDSFSHQATYTTAGPIHIGSYGSGTKPILGGSGNVFQVNASDWRFVDIGLDMADAADATGVYSTTTNVTNILELRVDCVGGQCMQTSGGSISGSTSGQWDGLFVFDSTCQSPRLDTGNGDNCFYLSGVRVVMIGNHCDMDSGSEHCFRTYAQRVVESHNTGEGIPAGRAFITNRSFNWTAGEGHPANTYSGTAVISLNREGTNVGGGVGYGPTNKNFDERCRDVIIESNRTFTRYTGACVDSVTIRNNIHNYSGGDAVTYDPPSMDFATWPAYPARTNFHIYNNTTFASATSDIQCFSHTGADVGYTYSDWTATWRNNLCIAPNDNINADVTFYTDTGITLTTCATCNTGGSGEIRTNPLSGTPSALSDFQPTNSSYPDGRGISVPVYDDFYGRFVESTRDIGAMIH